MRESRSRERLKIQARDSTSRKIIRRECIKRRKDFRSGNEQTRKHAEENARAIGPTRRYS